MGFMLSPEPLDILRWIAKNLIDGGANVRTLTNAKGRHNPFGDDLQIDPLDFDDSEGLVRSNADVLYNTYWVRYKKRSGGYDHSIATRNSMKLFEAACEEGRSFQRLKAT